MNTKIKIHLMYLIMALLLLLGCCALYMNYRYALEHHQRQQQIAEEYDYDEVQELVKPQEPAKKPVSGNYDPDMPVYDTEKMLSINPDFKGWLYIPDSIINFPVVQGKDNKKYLNTSFTNRRSKFGCLFLDATIQDGARSRVIHGHNMGRVREEMFSTLKKYQDQTYMDENKIAYFIEPDNKGDSVYEVFAVLNFNINHLEDFNYMQSEFRTEDDFLNFVQYLRDNSIVQSDFEPERDLLIFSTCNHAYGPNNRLLVCLGRKNAAPGPQEVSTSEASVN